MEGLYEEGGLATEDADRIFTSLPINILENMHMRLQERIAKLDQDLLKSLEDVGFKLDPYPAGMLIKYFRFVSCIFLSTHSIEYPSPFSKFPLLSLAIYLAVVWYNHTERYKICFFLHVSLENLPGNSDGVGDTT